MKVFHLIALVCGATAIPAKPDCPASKTCGFLLPDAEAACRADCQRNGRGKAERVCNNCCTTAAGQCINGIGNSGDFCQGLFDDCF
ncbi:hypothetical protein V2G26_007313 [Clonostachys chloroleuca]